MTSKPEPKLTIEIIPGKSIGPFQLGMTCSEINETLRQLESNGPISLEELGIVAWSLGDDGGWVDTSGSRRCTRLGIRVYNNDNEIWLMGQKVNNMGNNEAIKLFESFAGKVHSVYGGFDAATFGIDAVRWEDADPWIDSIFVTERRTQ